MADPESTSDKNPQITPQMFIDVIRGGGTPQERELILKAMKDPHSELRDWLEGMEAWAEKTFGRKSSSSEAADRMISEAVARQLRDDIVAFIHRQRSQGKISDQDVSRILTAGAIESSSTQPLTSDDYTNAAKMMFKLTIQLHPELLEEIDILLNERARNRNDRGPS